MTYRQRFNRDLLIFVLLVLLGAVSPNYSIHRRLSGRTTSSIQAAEVNSHEVFLPQVLQNYPFTTVFGVESSEITDDRVLQQLVKAGTSWIRLNGVLWSEVEPIKGQRDWSVLENLETEIKDASKYGIQVVLVVRKTPEWAQKIVDLENQRGYFCGPIKEEELGAFADFMYELVSRFSKPPYNVKYWEIWNEPDVDPEVADNWGETIPFGCWGDESDDYYGGGHYAEMLKAIYPKIKLADGESRVIVGGLLMGCDPMTYCTPEKRPIEYKPSTFLEGILNNGGGAYFDIVGFHAYDYYLGSAGQYGNMLWDSNWNTKGPLLNAKSQYIKGLLSKFNLSDKGLMSTETALICGQWNDPPASNGCESGWTSPYEITKAYYISQAYASAIAEGLQSTVWYSVLGWRNSGLLNADFSPRPAYAAMQFGRYILQDAEFEENVTKQDLGEVTNVEGYKFKNGDDRIWFLWPLDGEPHEISLSDPPRSIYDALGDSQSMSGSHSITIEQKPIYLVWNR